MSARAPMDDDAIRRFKGYAAASVCMFEPRFRASEARFRGWEALLSRFGEAVARVEAEAWDWKAVSCVDEVHNELCIADAVLSSTAERLRCQALQYEPPIPGCARTIDFRVHTEDGLTVHVDVKTVKPIPRDRWGQFQKALASGWIPDNISVVLSRDAHGGEIWHGWFAARSRMLEYSVETEAKISEGGLAGDRNLFVLALCGSGWEWHEDTLEDFVHFYRTGVHRDDDPFAQMELDHIRKNVITFTREISSFACLVRPRGHLHPRRLNWNVQSPPQPWLAL